jgi:hypothetical protein
LTGQLPRRESSFQLIDSHLLNDGGITRGFAFLVSNGTRNQLTSFRVGHSASRAALQSSGAALSCVFPPLAFDLNQLRVLLHLITVGLLVWGNAVLISWRGRGRGADGGVLGLARRVTSGDHGTGRGDGGGGARGRRGGSEGHKLRRSRMAIALLGSGRVQVAGGAPACTAGRGPVFPGVQ